MEIKINILGRDYTISAKDGDESKVREYAKKLDEQMNDLQNKIPNVSDINLFVINSLMRMSAENETPTQPETPAPTDNEISSQDLEKFEKIAIELETLAKKVKNI